MEKIFKGSDVDMVLGKLKGLGADGRVHDCSFMQGLLSELNPVTIKAIYQFLYENYKDEFQIDFSTTFGIRLRYVPQMDLYINSSAFSMYYMEQEYVDSIKKELTQLQFEREEWEAYKRQTPLKIKEILAQAGTATTIINNVMRIFGD